LTTTRRQFLSAALLALTPKSERPITGSFVNDDFAQGHLLRDRAAFPKPVETLKIPLVIVGAGVAGLSAAWRLDKRGFRDFVVLELAQQAGGNARWGENEITAYPWGAHYVPVPDKAPSWCASCLRNSEFFTMANGKSAICAFHPRSACLFTAAGRKISSPPSA